MKNNRTYPDIFIYGLSGAGKDSISDFICKNYGYRKMRIGRTIKQVVCETNNFTPIELETHKRTTPKLRKQHADVSNYLDEQCVVDKHNLNRLQMLIDRSSYDYELLTNTEYEKNLPNVYCDVRGFEEAKMLLQSGAVGIFLMRGSDDDTNKTHWTERSIFAPNKNKKLPSQMVQLMQIFGDKCYIVDNSKTKEITISTSNYLVFDVPNITAEILCEEVDDKILKKLIF